MIKKTYVDIDVLTAAKQRIINVFSNGYNVALSISGGKDSICLSDLVYKLCLSGQIDKSLLTVDFIDEEAIFPCVEKIVQEWRLKWLAIGVPFRWFCIECKHYNCLNMLDNDESFICWDREKKGKWCRDMPAYAIKSSPYHKARVESYQTFLERINQDKIQLIGVRTAESIQRRDNVARTKNKKKAFPIYDWEDVDIWHYLLQEQLNIPDVYMYMYQVGTNRKRMRISQFFSVDTIHQLVDIAQFYPGLFERICEREPNAYMVSLYYNTELYRKSNRADSAEKAINYKAKTLQLLADASAFPTPERQKLRTKYSGLIVAFATIISPDIWKMIYLALVGGDPKLRSYRAIFTKISQQNRGLK